VQPALVTTCFHVALIIRNAEKFHVFSD